MKRKIRVLHITPDDKFFDGVFASWENNEDFDNKALFFAPNRNYEFRYVKRVNVLEIYNKKKVLKERLQKDDYDVVFLHSMPCSFYKFVTWIPEDRIVIWWGWGHEIYESQSLLPPVVNVDLYKKKTKTFFNDFRIGFRTLYLWIKRSKTRRMQETAIRRVDYYQPVLKSEMELMRRNRCFKAKEFYYYVNPPVIKEFVEHPKDGDIIMGNSATPTNNHLDILKFIMTFKQKNQHVIIPLNYGRDKYKEWLTPHLQHDDIIPIYDFLPSNEYFNLVGNCTYAVYGNIRQQAMGNILYDIYIGIKVFLYKDSVPYQCLIDLGFVVFAIEDMTYESLVTPLSKEQMEQNNKARLEEHERRMALHNNCINEIKSYIRDRKES